MSVYVAMSVGWSLVDSELINLKKRKNSDFQFASKRAMLVG
jgi:hypothetical protein